MRLNLEPRQSTSRPGIRFIGLLTILFIGLKLTNHIDWSWWWVLSPIWGTALLVAVLLVAVGVLKAKAR